MDNEALKDSFKETLNDRGIILLTSPPYISQPNGVAERAGGGNYGSYLCYSTRPKSPSQTLARTIITYNLYPESGSALTT